jgi:(p)ppGpp synthase/HD superfamily hydrolase
VEAQATGYLHDVVKDTDATLDEVAELFGPLIAACVGILTDEPGEDRKARKVKPHQKMARVTGALELVLVVKAADRLANMEACIATGN